MLRRKRKAKAGEGPREFLGIPDLVAAAVGAGVSYDFGGV